MRIIVESPFRADSPEDRRKFDRYLLRALTNSFMRGEAPFASHSIYPQLLEDGVAAGRERGIAAGHQWLEVADAVAFYIDYSMSPGMRQTLRLAKKKSLMITYRRIGKNV